MTRIVVLYSGGRHWGGIETYLLNLFRLYDRRKMALVLVSMGEWELTQALRNEGRAAEVRVLSAKRARPRTVFALRRLLRAERAQLVVSQGVVANAYARLAVLGTGIPSLVVVHSDLAGDYPKRAVRWAYMLSDRALRRTTEHYVAVCRYLKDRLVASGVKPEQVTVVQNGVSLPGRRPRADAELRVAVQARPPESAGALARGAGTRLATVGRLHLVKNFDGLIRAMALLPPDTRLVIWGEGPERATLSSLIASLGLQDRVELCGVSDNMAQALEEADIYVQPSKSEGCSFTVAEAMLLGKPVVVTPCGGLPEQVTHGATGLVASDPSAEGLAAAISTLVRDRELAAKLAEAGQKAAEKAFAMDTWLEKTTAAVCAAARQGAAAAGGGEAPAAS
jgi:glycosyltransferase involved in cell wall biosynthesis